MNIVLYVAVNIIRVNAAQYVSISIYCIYIGAVYI